MKIYIDSDFRCHLSDKGNMISIETDFFNNKCDTFIEGYQYIPFGKSWVRSDGAVFEGVMIAPWKPYDELDAVQREYEQQKLLEYENEKNELIASYTNGVNSV